MERVDTAEVCEAEKRTVYGRSGVLPVVEEDEGVHIPASQKN